MCVPNSSPEQGLCLLNGIGTTVRFSSLQFEDLQKTASKSCPEPGGTRPVALGESPGRQPGWGFGTRKIRLGAASTSPFCGQLPFLQSKPMRRIDGAK
jgi:hypothetical protein